MYWGLCLKGEVQAWEGHTDPRVLSGTLGRLKSQAFSETQWHQDSYTWEGVRRFRLAKEPCHV